MKEDNVTLPVPKRVRQDNPFACKAMRVKKTAGEHAMIDYDITCSLFTV